jgi:hypothetical protein
MCASRKLILQKVFILLCTNIPKIKFILIEEKYPSICWIAYENMSLYANYDAAVVIVVVALFFTENKTSTQQNIKMKY